VISIVDIMPIINLEQQNIVDLECLSAPPPTVSPMASPTALGPLVSLAPAPLYDHLYPLVSSAPPRSHGSDRSRSDHNRSPPSRDDPICTVSPTHTVPPTTTFTGHIVPAPPIPTSIPPGQITPIELADIAMQAHLANNNFNNLLEGADGYTNSLPSSPMEINTPKRAPSDAPDPLDEPISTPYVIMRYPDNTTSTGIQTSQIVSHRGFGSVASNVDNTTPGNPAPEPKRTRISPYPPQPASIPPPPNAPPNFAPVVTSIATPPLPPIHTYAGVEQQNNRIFDLLTNIDQRSQRTDDTVGTIHNTLSTFSQQILDISHVAEEAKQQSTLANATILSMQTNFDCKMRDIEQRFVSLENNTSSAQRSNSARPNPTDTTRPNRNSTTFQSTDHIEAVIHGFPKRLRNTKVETLTKSIADITAEFDPFLMPFTGPWCFGLTYRFADRVACRDFIKTVNSSNLLDTSFDDVPIKLICRTIPPTATKFERKAVYFFKQFYRLNPTVCDEIIPFHGHRELTFFGHAVTYYVDNEKKQVAAREGGTACINKTEINRICTEKQIPDVAADFIKWINNELPEVAIFVM